MESQNGAKLVGTTLISNKRTITEGEFAMLLSLSWGLHPLHVDRDYAQARGFKDRILEGPIVLALAIGLEVTAGIGRMIDASGINLIALKEIENVRFTAPVYPGDTLQTTTNFIEVVPGRRPGRFGMRVQTEAFKDGEELVMRAVRHFTFDDE